DADGNYQFSNIPTGNYFVVVEYLGASSDQIAVNANPGVVAANFVKNNDHFAGALSLGTSTVQPASVNVRPTLLAANALVTIESQTIIQQVKVVDMLGSTVYVQKLNNNNTTIQLNNWAKGYYICEILDTNGNAHRTKIVVQ
ncbi:MAG TPA: T9SS type A sorting domain-containing protein, partial [Chitinophagales bacterium]|nr:T9SS type A sorting domain-containing protein [Chitinophagales bacterium]